MPRSAHIDEIYAAGTPITTPHPFLLRIEREYDSLPKITRLDEYMHFRDQLEQMRARSSDYIPERFAMEMALLCLLNDYDYAIGMPHYLMPAPDGKGGIEKPDILPEEWLAHRNKHNTRTRVMGCYTA